MKIRNKAEGIRHKAKSHCARDISEDYPRKSSAQWLFTLCLILFSELAMRIAVKEINS